MRQPQRVIKGKQIFSPVHCSAVYIHTRADAYSLPGGDFDAASKNLIKHSGRRLSFFPVSLFFARGYVCARGGMDANVYIYTRAVSAHAGVVPINI